MPLILLVGLKSNKLVEKSELFTLKASNIYTIKRKFYVVFYVFYFMYACCSLS